MQSYNEAGKLGPLLKHREGEQVMIRGKMPVFHVRGELSLGADEVFHVRACGITFSFLEDWVENVYIETDGVSIHFKS